MGSFVHIDLLFLEKLSDFRSCLPCNSERHREAFQQMFWETKGAAAFQQSILIEPSFLKWKKIHKISIKRSILVCS